MGVGVGASFINHALQKNCHSALTILTSQPWITTDYKLVASTLVPTVSNRIPLCKEILTLLGSSAILFLLRESHT